MNMNSIHSRGFTLIEMAVVVLVFGIVIAFSVPVVQSLTATTSLKGSAENIVAQFRVARQIAIGTGARQTLRFAAGVEGSDYRIENGGVVGAKWILPPGVTYHWGAGTVDSYTIGTNGRVTPSGMVIVQDRRGLRDTISVQASGLVTIR
jgi:prepilin-type N-terminal cleavage/methylation domain-containing protein